MTADEIIDLIAKERNLTISYTDDRDNCHIAGNEIFIGMYSDNEFKLISFFHELGHKNLQKYPYSTLLTELECWHMGIEIAKAYDILFSDRAIKFGFEKALTYVGHDERENSGYNKKLLWINK